MLVAEKVPLAAALAELKTYLKIESGAEDPLLLGLLRAATETVEAMLGVMLVEREVEERTIVEEGRARLSAEPVRSLVSVSRDREDGTVESIETEASALDVSRHGEGSLQVSGVREEAGLTVRYRAGMAKDWTWVPEVLRLSVVRAAAHFHARRDAADDAGLPPAVKRMLSPWKARRVR